MKIFNRSIFLFDTVGGIQKPQCDEDKHEGNKNLITHVQMSRDSLERRHVTNCSTCKAKRRVSC